MSSDQKYLKEQKQNLLTKREEHMISGNLNFVKAIDDIVAIIDSELEDEESSSSIRRI